MAGLIDPQGPSRSVKKVSKRKQKTIQASDEPLKPGVVYVGHIPHGFYEDEMKRYFSQFGHVKRVKLSRNKKVLYQSVIDIV